MPDLLVSPFFEVSMPEHKVSSLRITLNAGKQRISKIDFENLINLLNKKKVINSFIEMRQGAIVNLSEKRQALHTSLRDPSPEAPYSGEVHKTLDKICQFAERVRNWKWLGCRGDRITDVINVGIGGSDMGPRAVYNALRTTRPEIKVHFLASADGVAVDRLTAELDPYKTLIIISSKSFSTLETLSNCKEIFRWLKNFGFRDDDFKHHVVAVSANPKAASFLGLPDENFFPIWDWVGGRFSVWGAIGLPVAISLGENVFRRFLIGAHLMDAHTASAPIQKNLPALLAAFSYWNVENLGISSFCFLPYDERLTTLVPWLQQLEMESLGKSKTVKGNKVSEKTCVPVWGGHGNESQHSFYQFLREGTARTALDICWCEKPGHAHNDLHRVLLANAKAQAEALLKRENDDGCFNVVNTIVLDELSPETLGSLMAMYENKTAILGALLGINTFDQPGVELGKLLARKLL